MPIQLLFPTEKNISSVPFWTNNIRIIEAAFIPKIHYIGTTGEPAFGNSWVNYDAAAFSNAAFYKEANGIVHLQGLIKSGTMSGTAFILPKTCWPIKYTHFATISNAAFGGLRVDAAGQVIPVEGSNVWFNLDGCSFMSRDASYPV